jgi:DNA primase
MVISNGMYWCRSGNHSGLLWKLLKTPPSQEEIAKAKAISEAKEKKEAEQAKKEKREKLAKLNRDKPWIQFHNNLLQRPDLLSNLAQDGISELGIRHFQVGMIPDFHFWVDDISYVGEVFTFPIFHNKKCHGIRCRIIDPPDKGDKYRPYLSGLGASFFCADFWPRMDWVVIVEGEKKAIVLWENGIPAIGIQGCWTFKEEWKSYFVKRYKKIFLCLDPDKDGQRGAERLSKLLRAPSIEINLKPDDALAQKVMTTGDFLYKFVEKLYD